MPVGSGGAMRTADAFEHELEGHLENVREIYERVIYAQKPMYYTVAPPPRR